MNTQFARFLQIGIMVEDIEATIKRYEEQYGIGPWNLIDFGPGMFPQMLVDGKPGMLETRNAFCKVYGFELELIQPVTQDSPHAKWLREHGPGIHHIAVVTRDGFKDVLAEHERLTGRKPWIHCKEDNGLDGEGMEFAYLDLAKELGMMIEIYNEDRKGGYPA